MMWKFFHNLREQQFMKDENLTTITSVIVLSAMLISGEDFLELKRTINNSGLKR